MAHGRLRRIGRDAYAIVVEGQQSKIVPCRFGSAVVKAGEQQEGRRFDIAAYSLARRRRWRDHPRQTMRRQLCRYLLTGRTGHARRHRHQCPQVARRDHGSAIRNAQLANVSAMHVHGRLGRQHVLQRRAIGKFPAQAHAAIDFIGHRPSQARGARRRQMQWPQQSRFERVARGSEEQLPRLRQVTQQLRTDSAMRFGRDFAIAPQTAQQSKPIVCVTVGRRHIGRRLHH